MVAEKALYCFDELTQTYLLLDTTNTYDSKKEYYVVAPKSRINYPTTITKASLISGSIFLASSSIFFVFSAVFP